MHRHVARQKGKVINWARALVVLSAMSCANISIVISAQVHNAKPAQQLWQGRSRLHILLLATFAAACQEVNFSMRDGTSALQNVQIISRVAATVLCQPTQPGYVFTAAGFVSGSSAQPGPQAGVKLTPAGPHACVAVHRRLSQHVWCQQCGFGNACTSKVFHLGDSTLNPFIRSAATLPAGICGFDTPLRTLTQEM